MVLEELAATEGLEVEAVNDVVRASLEYRHGDVGFSDLMIMAAATRSGAHPLYTFDKKAGQLSEAALLEEQASI